MQKVIIMAENNIDDLRQRTLRRPPVNHRKLENRSLDLEVPLEHLTTETLPLEAHETLGVGYGFDRLYALDLRAEQPVPIPLPSRHELYKITRGGNTNQAVNLAYQGFDFLLGGDDRRTSEMTDGTTLHDFANSYFGSAANGGSHSYAQVSNGSATHNAFLEEFAKAFIGSGHSTDRSNSVTWTLGPRVDTNPAGIASGSSYDVDAEQQGIYCDPEGLQKLTDGSGNFDRRTVRSLQYFYNAISPSAWETVLTNRKVLTELPKNLAYLDRAFYSLYQRDRIGAFKTKIRDLTMLHLVLGMTEAMYAIRRGRFSRNISPDTSLGHANVKVMRGKSDNGEISNIGGGVMNPFFQMLDNGRHQLLVAPWWLINKLNHTLYLDTDRDEEVRDVERKDITELMNLLLEAMEVERGLHFSSESNIPMITFDKFKEAALPDFSNFTDTKAALSATLLGFQSPRDAYYDNPETSIGRLPYFSTIATTQGTIIGKDRLEFLDRLKEQETHNVMSSHPEKFKQGMQYANPFDYTTMVTRTRFGDHSMDVKVYPFGFYRGVVNDNANSRSYFRISKSAGSEHENNALSHKNKFNLVFFPAYNWAQFNSTMGSRGFLPEGLDGAAWCRGNSVRDIVVDTPNSLDAATSNDQLLWSEHYWRPGLDNYTARLLSSTDEMFQSWIDRGEQVRAEGATFPTIGPINLMAEMTFTTPMAIFQRNWPWLRKMCTFTASSAVPTDADTSFDYMYLGDNMFNMSLHTTQAPLSLENRDLFNPLATGNLRSSGLDLAPMVLPLSKAPDNWVGVFQARDAMYFLTSLLSEPIMDAYTSNTNALGKTNGTGSARLVVYQGAKTFEGRVEDVYCTPIAGVGPSVTAAGGIQRDVDFTSAATRSHVFLHTGSALHANNYQMFLLSPNRISAGSCIVSRLIGPTGSHATEPRFLLGGENDTGDLRTGRFMITTGSSPIALSEDDFVPGLYWDKLWIPESSLIDASGAQVPYGQVFSFPYLKTANATDVGITYMRIAGGSGAGLGFELGADLDHTVDQWRTKHVEWIELVRTNLEYQRANVSFYIFDKDICDIKESYLRQSLFPLGFSTIGPLTYVGALGAEGQQVASETISGPTVFELSSLTLGSGTLDESPSEPDDSDVGVENPSLHIADKQDV